MKGTAVDFRMWSAAERGDIGLVEQLLARKGVPPRDGSTRRHRLRDYNAGSAWMLTKQGDGHDRTPTPTNPTPMHIAARRGHEQVVQLLADAGADVNDQQTHCEQNTPLHLAVQGGHMGVTWCLLSRPTLSIVREDVHGRTAMDAAHDPEILDALRSYPHMKLLIAEQRLAFTRGAVQTDIEEASSAACLAYDILVTVCTQLCMPNSLTTRQWLMALHPAPTGNAEEAFSLMSSREVSRAGRSGSWGHELAQPASTHTAHGTAATDNSDGGVLSFVEEVSATNFTVKEEEADEGVPPERRVSTFIWLEPELHQAEPQPQLEPDDSRRSTTMSHGQAAQHSPPAWGAYAPESLATRRQRTRMDQDLRQHRIRSARHKKGGGLMACCGARD
jgi:hypothetical protein